jgi:ferredoxin--NADP+ reductase
VVPEAPEGAIAWEGWRAIDEVETAAGEAHGRPRVKLVRVEHMHDAASAAKTA